MSEDPAVEEPPACLLVYRAGSRPFRSRSAATRGVSQVTGSGRPRSAGSRLARPRVMPYAGFSRVSSGAVVTRCVRRRRKASGRAASTSDVPVTYPRVAPPGDRNAYLQAFRRSPLTDSNRRPPPYHLALRSVHGNSASNGAFPAIFASSSARSVCHQRALSRPRRPRARPQNLSPTQP
jgi:hypothetical protein